MNLTFGVRAPFVATRDSQDTTVSRYNRVSLNPVNLNNCTL
jgi:hypothetical protein